MKKYQRFLSENFHFLLVKFLIYLNRHVFVMHVQHGNTGWIKRKLNPLGSDGKILLCDSCGSYRHLVAECLDC